MILNTKKNIYIVTTSLPYVNSTPHLGFAMEAVISDVIARYLRSLGKKVVFVTGTDDNSFKLVYKARENNENVKSFIDRFANNFNDLRSKLGLSYDVFYRTSDKKHEDFVNDYLDYITPELIYRKKFQSYFCQDCESFVGLNVNFEKKCPIHNKEYAYVDEQDYFLKVDSYKEKILKNINEKVILPELEKKNSLDMCNDFKDFNFTRENKYNWGLVYKKDKEYVFYSFFDALLGYLGAIEKLDLSNDVCMIQNIGRDILKFHSVYFPYMLFVSNKYKTPDYLLVHGFVNLNNEKMSKSKGNIISVDQLLSQFDKNVVRVYLLSKNIFNDFDFSYLEIEFISEIYKKYTTNFVIDFKNVEKDGDIYLFDEYIRNFELHKIVEEFIRIINKNDSFIELTMQEKRFLSTFRKIFFEN